MSRCECGHNCDCHASGFGKFLGGLVVGASLVYLFSPKSGKENREDLKNKYNELKDYVSKLDMDEVKEELQNKLEELRKDIESLDKETVLRRAKKLAEDVQEKATELYEYACKKASPVVEKYADALREKAHSVALEVVDKLEKEETEEKEVKKETKKSTK